LLFSLLRFLTAGSSLRPAEATKQSTAYRADWIASRSLPTGVLSRDPSA
jgi:hypothetical protein